jgi:hypothetical protein
VGTIAVGRIAIVTAADKWPISKAVKIPLPPHCPLPS